MDRDDLGFLLAKATQRWNELLQERFRAAGWGEVRPSYGSILVPLFEEDGLRMGELARRARLSKQTMTTMVRLLERDGLVTRAPDPADGRAALVHLTKRARELIAAKPKRQSAPARSLSAPGLSSARSVRSTSAQQPNHPPV